MSEVLSIVAHQSETHRYHGHTPVMPVLVVRESITWIRGHGMKRFNPGKAWVTHSVANLLLSEERAARV